MKDFLAITATILIITGFILSLLVYRDNLVTTLEEKCGTWGYTTHDTYFTATCNTKQEYCRTQIHDFFKDLEVFYQGRDINQLYQQCLIEE